METIVVYSGKSLNTIRKENGLGDWAISPIRAEACDYVVSCRNLREPFAARDAEHGMAVFIAKVDSVIPSVHVGRCRIIFTQYAMLNIDGAWKVLTKGQRCPVGYFPTEQVLKLLQLDAESLAWRELNEVTLLPPQPEPQVTEPPLPSQPAAIGSVVRPASDLPVLVAETKRTIAQELGISVNKIDIKITL